MLRINTIEMDNDIVRISIVPDGKSYFSSESINEINAFYGKYTRTIDRSHLYNKPENNIECWVMPIGIRIEVKKEDIDEIIKYLNETLVVVK